MVVSEHADSLTFKLELFSHRTALMALFSKVQLFSETSPDLSKQITSFFSAARLSSLADFISMLSEDLFFGKVYPKLIKKGR